MNTPWYRTITAEQWRVLFAAKAGWMLDAMDFLLYIMAIGQLKAYFGFDDATAGLLGTVTLIVSAIGGIVFGALADRLGRVRALILTVVIFSICSLGAATSQSLLQLLVWRLLLGFGMGGEWATGAALVSEHWPAEHRGKAVGIMQSGWALGYILAAVAAALILGTLDLGPEGWRWLFVVGALPATLTFWIQRRIPEPALWREQKARSEKRGNPYAVLFGSHLRRRTVLASLLTAAVQFGYWGLFFWLPTFLGSPVEKGGAGLTIVKSMSWLIPVQIGAYFGYLSFGFLADYFGRRRTFIAFLVVVAAAVPLYGQFARNPLALMILGPIIGFAGHGYFSVFGAMLAELFPTAVRATGQALVYNLGRGLGAFAPYTIGVLAAMPHGGIGSALGATSAFFLMGAVLMLTLPDTNGAPLEG